VWGNHSCFVLHIELTKECERLKKVEPGVSGEEGLVLEELQVVRGERDQAVNEAKTIRQTVTALNRERQVSRWTVRRGSVLVSRGETT
jgi:hypothetical protein